MCVCVCMYVCEVYVCCVYILLTMDLRNIPLAPDLRERNYCVKLGSVCIPNKDLTVDC